MAKNKGEVSKKSKTGYYLITAIVFVILGVLTIMYRGQIAGAVDNIIKWVVAGVFAIVAVINIIQFAKNPGKSTIGDLLLGIGAVIAMIIVLVMSGMIIWIIRIGFGIYLIYEGVTKIINSFKIKKVSKKVWIVLLVLGIVCALAGALVVFKPFGDEVFILIVGIILLYTGIANLVNAFIKAK